MAFVDATAGGQCAGKVLDGLDQAHHVAAPPGGHEGDAMPLHHLGCLAQAAVGSLPAPHQQPPVLDEDADELGIDLP
jgi:hypothetical protein